MSFSFLGKEFSFPGKDFFPCQKPSGVPLSEGQPAGQDVSRDQPTSTNPEADLKKFQKLHKWDPFMDVEKLDIAGEVRTEEPKRPKADAVRPFGRTISGHASLTLLSQQTGTAHRRLGEGGRRRDLSPGRGLAVRRGQGVGEAFG